jgi:hypothetical protein
LNKLAFGTTDMELDKANKAQTARTHDLVNRQQSPPASELPFQNFDFTMLAPDLETGK